MENKNCKVTCVHNVFLCVMDLLCFLPCRIIYYIKEPKFQMWYLVLLRIHCLYCFRLIFSFTAYSFFPMCAISVDNTLFFQQFSSVMISLSFLSAQLYFIYLLVNQVHLRLVQVNLVNHEGHMLVTLLFTFQQIPYLS